MSQIDQISFIPFYKKQRLAEILSNRVSREIFPPTYESGFVTLIFYLYA